MDASWYKPYGIDVDLPRNSPYGSCRDASKSLKSQKTELPMTANLASHRSINSSKNSSINIWAALGFVTLTIIWGTQFLVIKIGQVDLPPLMTAALRFALLTVAAQVAVLLTGSQATFDQRLRRASFGLTQAVSFGLLYWAQSRIPSALAGVLSATSPLFVAIIAHRFVAGERLNRTRVLALILGFLGVSIIGFDMRSASGVAATLAVLAILVGELAAATNKVLAKQLTTSVPVPLMLRDMGLVVTLLIGLASCFFERHMPIKFTPTSIFAFAYLGLVASFAASGLYLLLLRRYTVTVMAYMQFATASVAAAAGVLVGGEHLGPSLITGTLAVIAGLLMLSLRDRGISQQPANVIVHDR